MAYVTRPWIVVRRLEISAKHLVDTFNQFVNCDPVAASHIENLFITVGDSRGEIGCYDDVNVDKIPRLFAVYIDCWSLTVAISWTN